MSDTPDDVFEWRCGCSQLRTFSHQLENGGTCLLQSRLIIDTGVVAALLTDSEAPPPPPERGSR